MNYTLTFWEAVEECLNNNTFIRGENFAKGYYIKNQNDVLVMVDGNNTHHEVMFNMLISKGNLNQKYKSFIVANKKELGIE